MITKVLGEMLQIGVKVVAAILAVTLLINGGKWAYAEAYDLMSRTPTANQEIRNVYVDVPKGATTETIANILEESGLIDSTLYFRLISRLNGFDGYFQYGSYTFSTGQSEEDMMEILLTEGAKRATKTFTIVEGLTLNEVAESLSVQGLCSEIDFFSALDNTNWGYKVLESIPRSDDRKVLYQGYLFPSTYEVYEDATAVDIIATMFHQMDVIWTDEYYAQAQKMNMTVDEVMSIASIIEKEVVAPNEQPRVAGVIYNRLENSTPLQMCSTVMYVLDLDRSYLTYDDLEVDSPYNTYKYPGLPVGPIANPGSGAIRAALYPEEHDYLYFVLKDDGSGTHEFNTTLQEHNRDKAKYKNAVNF